VYVIIAVYWKDETLLTSQAFTSITLIQLLTRPVLMYIQVIPGLVQCIGSFDRIQTYCNYSYNAGDNDKQRLAHDVQSSDVSLGPLPPNIVRHTSNQKEQQHAVTLDGHDFAWKKEQPAVLKDIRVKIEHGKITMLVGPVGSGKSTLLESILGETLSSSSVLRDQSSTAYCSQQPWLENDY
jgi:ABC-type bacteriocin/lantibiotic exporter with double-glycine peptidase domain